MGRWIMIRVSWPSVKTGGLRSVNAGARECVWNLIASLPTTKFSTSSVARSTVTSETEASLLQDRDRKNPDVHCKCDFFCENDFCESVLVGQENVCKRENVLGKILYKDLVFFWRTVFLFLFTLSNKRLFWSHSFSRQDLIPISVPQACFRKHFFPHSRGICLVFQLTGLTCLCRPGNGGLHEHSFCVLFFNFHFCFWKADFSRFQTKLQTISQIFFGYYHCRFFLFGK